MWSTNKGAVYVPLYHPHVLLASGDILCVRACVCLYMCVCVCVCVCVYVWEKY